MNGPVGFFGKIPTHGDFVRGNVGDPLAQRLVRWLEEATEACHRAKGQLSQEPIRFLFRPAGESRSLVGVLRGSQDRVGRQFPLAILAPVAGPVVEGDFPSSAHAFRSFFEGASAALAGDPASPATLGEAVASLPPPAPDATAGDETRAHSARPSGEMLQRLFGDGADGRRHYAAHTFLSACATVREREPARAEVVLDCPVGDAGDVWAWLELARLALGWGVPPPLFLRPGAPGRLLLSLGAPPPAVLPALCDPPRDHPKIWPLATTSAAAVAAARKALGEGRCAALDGGRATLAELARELVGGR